MSRDLVAVVLRGERPGPLSAERVHRLRIDELDAPLALAGDRGELHLELATGLLSQRSGLARGGSLLEALTRLLFAGQRRGDPLAIPPIGKVRHRGVVGQWKREARF